ncbi:HIT family protein [Candidatus Poriferisocius sp.]|uniref:HIT family protein n=1 Tax=Candidatus Poriferisocius sp. TaxID=3101276 RepID=UPI003B01CA95
MLEHLWAPWRSHYVAGGNPTGAVPGEGTLFERILAAPEPDEETGIVWRGKTCFAVLNAHPYGSGHVLVAPNRAAADLADLSKTESDELWDAVRATVAAIRRAYHPHGVNVGINLGAAAGAGVPDHLHVHCLPRWRGDTNFMTATAETRVLPESLSESWSKLRNAWEAG